jgi:pimeloyl-ACP methyl ester carboxylesterase
MGANAMTASTTYVLIHGAADSASSWDLVAAELRARGHDVVAVDLPSEDAAAGLSEYTDTVVEAIGHRTGLVVVAHSLGGFTAPLVCTRVPVDLLVLVAAMVPSPGETGQDWWVNTGHAQARHELAEHDGDPIATFLHDVPPELAAAALARERDQAYTPMLEPWPLDAWPDVPTRYLLCREDRMFPAQWTRELVPKRLGIVPDEIDGGHAPYLSRPVELVEHLEAYRVAAAVTPAPPR